MDLNNVDGQKDSLIEDSSEGIKIKRRSEVLKFNLFWWTRNYL